MGMWLQQVVKPLYEQDERAKTNVARCYMSYGQCLIRQKQRPGLNLTNTNFTLNEAVAPQSTVYNSYKVHIRESQYK